MQEAIIMKDRFELSEQELAQIVGSVDLTPTASDGPADVKFGRTYL